MASRAEQLFIEALGYFDAGDTTNAALRLREALALAPGNISVLTNLAVVYLQQGKYSEARESAEQALTASPGNVEALLVAAACCARQERFAEAIASYDTIIALEPRLAEVHSDRAHALNRLRRYEDAVMSCDQAIALQPGLAGAHVNRGNALVQLDRYGDALAAYDAGLRLRADLPEAWLGRGNALAGQRRHEEALAAYDRAIALRADTEAAWLGRAGALAEFKRFSEANAALDRAFVIKPELAGAWLCRGNIFRLLARFDDAFAAYDKALATDPTLAEAWQSRGEALLALGRPADAYPAYDRALALKPTLKYLAGLRLHTKTWICDWTKFESERAELLTTVRSGVPVVEPLVLLAISASASDQLACGKAYVADKFSHLAPSGSPAPALHDRIRIAYISPDFRDHPVAFLTAGLFEQHDRNRFETFGISFGPYRPSAMRERLVRAFTRFIEVSDRIDAEVVALLRELQIDIAVDLAGYTLAARPGILAGRPAPVQVSYIGFPATTGAPFIDYLVADRIVVPPELRDRYSEAVVWLPDCFQVNDAKRELPAHTPTRVEMGLPERGFVYCAFHSTYKINPSVFDIWMRLLQQVDGSILWLVADHPGVAENLRREAQARGVAADRLIFAGRLAYADHLARHRLADLFLDTLPFNGGTTTSDALWMGLPVVTLPGEAFASRMSASLLNAIGLAELIARSPEDYEARALELARDPRRLADLKARLARQRTTHPLFDTARFTRQLEAAYTEMCSRQRRGEPPAGFAVETVA